MLSLATAAIMSPPCRCLLHMLFVCGEAVGVLEDESTVVASLWSLAGLSATWEAHSIAEACRAGNGACSRVTLPIHWLFAVWTPVFCLQGMMMTHKELM